MADVACSKCGSRKPRDREHFSVDRRRPDGLGSWCRDCSRECVRNANARRRAKMTAEEKRAERQRLVERYADLPIASSKRCADCEETKCAEAFARDRGRKDGLQAYCRDCGARRNRHSYRRHKRRRLARQREYYAQNRRKIRARGKRYYRANRDEILQGHREYHANNRPQWAERAARRRAQLRGSLFEKIDRDAVYVRDGGRCHLCGKMRRPDDWHMDHIVPIAGGGEHRYRNVAVACPRCNREKGHTGPGQMLLPVFAQPNTD